MNFWFIFIFLISSLAAVQSANASHHGDVKALQSCFRKWGKVPFSKADPEYRKLKVKIKILGIGGNLTDEKATEKPDLVLVKANVSVLSSAKMKLLNPNGWYCLKGKVSVLGKTTVQAACHAHVASTGGDGANVLGANDTEGGTTVLGSARIKRMGCATRDETEAAEAADKKKWTAVVTKGSGNDDDDDDSD